jgi:hypothetical protein
MKGRRTDNDVANKRRTDMMIIFFFLTPIRFLASCIWNLSEFTGISLGKYGITIFNLMMGCKGTKINKQ